MDRTPRTITAIVDEQVKRWELTQAKRKRAAAPPPVVTVSRQYGARGAAVAHLVSDRLFFHYWNRELVTELAHHAHQPELVIADLDEHHVSTLGETIRGSGMVRPQTLAVDYFRELVHVVHDLGARGAAVIVGRGAHYLLPEARTLRVRVIAPLEARIAGLVERLGLTAAEARAEIDRVDRDRRQFTREHFHREADDPAEYDVAVNTAALGVSGAADVVVAAYRARFASL